MENKNENGESMDWFRYPIDWQQVEDYKLSTLIGKERQFALQENEGTGIDFCEGPYCTRNGRVVTSIPKFQCCESEEKLSKRYGIYGPNCAIYLGFLNRLALFMLLCAVILGSLLLALNSTNNMCTRYSKCLSQLPTYTISLFNILNRPGTMKAEVIIWLIASVILTIFFLYLRVYAVKMYKKINNQNVTEADYSIILRRVPLKSTKQNIEEFIKTIKEEIIRKQNEEQDSKTKLTQAQINDILKIQYIVMLCKMDEVMDKLNKEVKRFKESIKAGSYKGFQRKIFIQKERLRFSGTVIVVFSSIRANDLIHSIVRYSVLDTILCYFFAFIRPRTQFKIRNKYISIHRAPEPRDLLWTNLGFSQKNRVKRKILYTLLTFILVGASAVTLYFIAKAELQINNLLLTISMVFIVFIFNFIIRVLLNKALDQQKIDTMTNYNAEKVYLNAIYQSLNLGFFNLVIPFLIKLPNIYQGILAADFPNYMIITMVFVFLGIHLNFLQDYFQIFTKISKILTKNQIIIKTQHEANEDFKSPKLQLDEKYSNFVQLFWFGLIFGILSPLCIVVSAVCFLFHILYERILFNSKYSIPEYTRIRTSTSFINGLEHVVIFIGLVNLGIHQILASYYNSPMDADILAMCIAIIVIGAVLVITPWNYILEKLSYNIFSDAQQMLYQDKKAEFEVTYEDANPATSLDFTVVVAEKIKQKNNPEVMYKVQRKSDTERQMLQQFRVQANLR